MDILSEIVTHTRVLIEQRKKTVPQAALEQMIAAGTHQPLSLLAALTEERPHIIAEFKRKSPSRPNINLEADPISTAQAYEQGGASAISVLTEPDFFGGSPDDLKRIRTAVSLPLLRKDFIIDPYQVYEARAWGADLILLIARILDTETLSRLTLLAHELGMEVLCEIHHLEEYAPVGDAPIDFLGVNCRDLKRFDTNIERLKAITAQLPEHTPWVAESGIHGQADLRDLFDNGYACFLIGEFLMRGNTPRDRLEELLR